MIRAVVDANVLISALIRPQGPPGQILFRLLRERAFELVVSPATLEELTRAIRYPRVRRYLSATDEEIDAWIESLALIADVVEGRSPTTAVIEDPEDEIYLSAALEGLADFLVTGDRHLLPLKEFQGVRIVTPKQFLQLLGA